MKTIVYLIRHSVRFNNKEMIESYKTTQNALLNSIKCNRRKKSRNLK